MSELPKYISIISILVSIIVGVYVYRELSNTRAKVGEIKFLKNNMINIESRLLDITKQIKNKNKFVIPGDDESNDSGSTSSEEYDVLESSDDDNGYNDSDNETPIEPEKLGLEVINEE